VITLSDFRVRYGAATAVHAARFAARAGEVVALVGPNGSGKSSLLKGIAGLVPSTGGRTIEGRLAFMPQDNGASAALSVIETVLLGRLSSLGLSVPPIEVERAAGMLVSLGIADLAARILGDLSGGQRQLVFLAQALASAPDILLLDEPTSALDVRNALALLERLRLEADNGRCVVVAIHDLNAALRFFDRVVVLGHGAVVADGAPAAALTGAVVEAVYGVRATVIHNPEGRSAITFDPIGPRERAAGGEPQPTRPVNPTATTTDRSPA